MIIDILKYKGLGKRIFISFSVLIFAILAFQQFATYYIIHVTAQNINSSYISVGLKQKNDKLNDFLKDIDVFSKSVISERGIQDLLSRDKKANTRISQVSHEIGYALSNNIDAIFLVSKEGNVYQEADSDMAEYITRDLDRIRSGISGSSGEMVFFGSRFINYGSGKDGDNFFLMARKIRSIDTFEDIGFLVVAIRESELWSNMVMEGDMGEYYIISGDGSIISSRDKELIGENIFTRLKNVLPKGGFDFNKGTYIKNGLILNSCSNSITNWHLMNVVAINELNANYFNLQWIVLGIGFIAIIIAVYISIIISGKITRPVRDMIHSMKKVMKGNLDVQADASLTRNSTDELIELNDVFNQMTRELQYLIEKVYQENLREKDAELRALRAQINPHFLYNTLDTIYWMLVEKEDYEVSDLVTRLGEILRYSIKKGSAMVTVSEELHQIENYLFIQKARFEDKLDYTIEMDEGILGCEIMSFLLQPFVENSVNHGLMEGKGSGHVGIKGSGADGELVFEITDDGAGIPQEQLDRLRSGRTEKEAGLGGIGIVNVQERIRNYYGEAYGVSIESSIRSGTRVVIRIPIKGLGSGEG